MFLRRAYGAVGLLAALPALAAAQIFAGVDAEGTTVLSNFQSETTPHLVSAPVAQAVARNPAASRGVRRT